MIVLVVSRGLTVIGDLNSCVTCNTTVVVGEILFLRRLPGLLMYLVLGVPGSIPVCSRPE